jgi:hypothetical protein
MGMGGILDLLDAALNSQVTDGGGDDMKGE